ncbi:MAG: 6-phosphofructokinase [Planctomycetota bacterium]|jgi:6-phosphofructokinase 1
MKGKRIGILVGGGPAPGINAVIGAATIEAVNQGLEVIGFYEGFRWLCDDGFDPSTHTVRLDIPMVARLHFRGGSTLRTSRISLLDDERLKTSTVVAPHRDKVKRVVNHLSLLGIGQLITIGGDDTALSARFVCEAAQGAIRLVHVPKTIDNDLPLPHDITTFGYASARFLGSQIVKNLMQDSRTTGRWYLVTAMGRKAGWLAMGIGLSAGATVSLLPEEFADNIRLQAIADVLEGAMLKRRVMGRKDGVALLAEGLAYRLGDREELQRLLGKQVPVDAAGHLRLSEVPLGDMLSDELERRFKARGESVTLVSHELGYELRSADPTPGDMAYCRSLGHGSIRLLLEPDEQSAPGVMVSLINGNLVPVDLGTLVDLETNRTQTRLVDVHSYAYQVARAYQIRLESSDLDDPAKLAKLAAEAKMTPEAFRTRYARAATRLPGNTRDT